MVLCWWGYSHMCWYWLKPFSLCGVMDDVLVKVRVCVCVRAWTGRWGLLSMKGANDLEREMKREAWWRQGLACFVPRVRQHGQGISAAAASSLHFLHSACLISARTHTHTHAHAHIDEAIPQRHNEHGLASGRLSKVFPVTWTTAASTEIHSSGTTLAGARSRAQRVRVSRQTDLTLSISTH